MLIRRMFAFSTPDVLTLGRHACIPALALTNAMHARCHMGVTSISSVEIGDSNVGCPSKTMILAYYSDCAPTVGKYCSQRQVAAHQSKALKHALQYLRFSVERGSTQQSNRNKFWRPLLVHKHVLKLRSLGHAAAAMTGLVDSGAQRLWVRWAYED